MTYRLRNIGIAVALAIVAALLTTFYVTNYKRTVQQGEQKVPVYVASHDIALGTPGSEIAHRNMLRVEDVPRRSVVPGAISSPDQVASQLTRQDIYLGEQISLRRFADHAEQGVRSQLHGTLRAISLPGTPDAVLAGTLKDGDHVDMIANLKTGDCSTCFASRVVARDVLVLHAYVPSVGSKVANTTETSVLLAVHDRREAQKIFFTVQNASGWGLELRPVANATDSPEDVETEPSILKDGVSAQALTHALGVTK